jgi:hypothetical protein
MALMCVFDIMASVCMALTTLPMPSDDVLRFAGHMIGNTVTCQVQGYIIMFGLIGGGSLYMCLSWYFVLKISLKWDLDTIKTKMEPLFYFVSIFMAIFLPSYCLSKNMIHSVKDNSFCRIAPDHSSCNYSNDKIFFDCEQELFDEYDYVQNIFINYRYCNSGLIAVAMTIIIWTIRRQNGKIKAVENRRERDDDDDDYNEDDSPDMQ